MSPQGIPLRTEEALDLILEVEKDLERAKTAVEEGDADAFKFAIGDALEDVQRVDSAYWDAVVAADES